MWTYIYIQSRLRDISPDFSLALPSAPSHVEKNPKKSSRRSHLSHFRLAYVLLDIDPLTHL